MMGPGFMICTTQDDGFPWFSNGAFGENTPVLPCVPIGACHPHAPHPAPPVDVVCPPEPEPEPEPSPEPEPEPSPDVCESAPCGIGYAACEVVLKVPEPEPGLEPEPGPEPEPEPLAVGIAGDEYGFVCHCYAGFTGEMCEIDVDECVSAPCQNNGACVDSATDLGSCTAPTGLPDAGFVNDEKDWWERELCTWTGQNWTAHRWISNAWRPEVPPVCYDSRGLVVLATTTTPTVADEPGCK